MAFFDAQTIASIAFVLFLTLFLLLKKKNLKTHKILFPLLYFSMYRTKYGLEFMDNFSRRFRKSLSFLSYAGIVVGFIGMILISGFLVKGLLTLLTQPDAKASISPVLPFKARGIFFIPFFYWIISIFIIAFVHEMAHGVIARLNNIKVKSSGFAFFGVLLPLIPAAFVEPDEKELKKRPSKQQLAIFAAGPFSNIIFGFIFLAIGLFIMGPLVGVMIEPNGVKITGYVESGKNFPAESAQLKEQVINSIDNNEIKTVNDLSNALGSKRPGQFATIGTDKGSYKLKLAQNPEDETKAYLGAFLEQDTTEKPSYAYGYMKILPAAASWIYTLMIILFMLNLGVGLFNLVPIGPLDGGRMLNAALLHFFPKEKAGKMLRLIGLFFVMIVLIHLAFAFIRPA